MSKRPRSSSKNFIRQCCTLCNEQFVGYGNNPDPLATDGVCCDTCNIKQVIPARVKEETTPRKNQKEVEIKVEPIKPEKKKIEVVWENEYVVVPITTCMETVGWKGKRRNKEITCDKPGNVDIRCGWGTSMVLCNECYTKKLDNGYFAYKVTPVEHEDSD